MKWVVVLVMACCFVAICGVCHMVLTSPAFVPGERVAALAVMGALAVGAVAFAVAAWRSPF